MHFSHVGLKRVAMGSAAMLLAIIVLLPFYKNGFWADDALNSQIRGMVDRFNYGVLAFSADVVGSWLSHYGRLLLPWPFIYSFFYVLESEWAVRMASMMLFIAHVGLTLVLLRKLGVGWRLLCLFVLCLMGLLQIRDSGDPIAAYAGFGQSVGILLTLSLMALRKWHVTQSPLWLASSSMIAASSMTLYEINLVYMPIAVAAVILARHPRTLRSLAVVTLPFVLFLAVTAYVKQLALTPYAGAALGALSAVPETFLKQLLATLPGSFYLMDGRHAYLPGALFQAAANSVLAWGVLLLWSALAISQLKRGAKPQTGLFMAAFAASMLLMVPPLLISLSAKYQASLNWGHAHVPVYYQAFGLALLVAAGLDRLAHGQARRWVMAGVPLAGLWLALNWTLNMHQSATWDAEFREPRHSLVQAMHGGLFDEVRDGDVVRIEGQPMYINGNLIYQTIQKNVSIPNEAAIAGWFESQPRVDARVYRLVRDASAGNQWKLLAQ